MIYALNNTRFLRDPDPFVLFEQMGVTDAAHAFYLGYELMKAKTALTSEQELSSGSSAGVGFLDGAGSQPPRAARGALAPGQSGTGTLSGRSRGSRGIRRGERVILEGIVTTLSLEGVLEHRADGARGSIPI